MKNYYEDLDSLLSSPTWDECQEANEVFYEQHKGTPNRKNRKAKKDN